MFFFFFQSASWKRYCARAGMNCYRQRPSNFLLVRSEHAHASYPGLAFQPLYGAGKKESSIIRLAQRMFGRRTKILIPTTNDLFKRKLVEDVPGKLFKRKQGEAKYYNISAKELPPLSSGNVVRLKPTHRSGRWYKARVEQQVDVRLYDVRTEDGRVFKRNRRHLRSSKEPFCGSTNPVAHSSPGVAPTNLIPPANPISGESSTSQEVQLPKDATELVAKDKVNSSGRPEEIPGPTKPQ